MTSKDGRYAYTANAGPGTISGFTVGNDGSLTLLTPGGATASLGATSHPLDEAITRDGRYLYNLTDGLHRISGFSIGKDGGLTGASFVAGLPAGAGGSPRADRAIARGGRRPAASSQSRGLSTSRSLRVERPIAIS